LSLFSLDSEILFYRLWAGCIVLFDKPIGASFNYSIALPRNPLQAGNE
jgi:hypothetical protein